MKSKTYADVFSRTLAKSLLDFKAAVERSDKSEAHIHERG